MSRPWALPLVPLYRAAVQFRNARWDRGQGVERLQLPVISVGSLAAGGAGKTPVVMLLAEVLRRHGVEADVLSRGYGRTSQTVEEVTADGSAGQFGDEPLELARAGLRVFVGASRLAAGQLAEGTGGPQVHLLDDGFQHRTLWRNLDVVLVTLADARDGLLPAGDLREPFDALGRADVVVVREEEAQELEPWLARRTAAQTWIVRRKLSLPAPMPERPVAFCGIARPDGFFAGLRELGCEPASEVRFRDHHAYRERDFEALVRVARRAQADGFVTTAKDAVKLGDDARRLLAETGPVAVASLRVSLLDEDAAWQTMERVLTDAVRK